jgi:hypothetical protein
MGDSRGGEGSGPQAATVITVIRDAYPDPDLICVEIRRRCGCIEVAYAWPTIKGWRFVSTASLHDLQLDGCPFCQPPLPSGYTMEETDA